MPLAQVRADFENQVPARKTPLLAQLRQHVRRHDAGAGTDLHDVPAPQAGQDFNALRSETTAEQGRNLRRRHEVSVGPEFATAGAVVAEPGLVERFLHEAFEAHPAVVALDLVADGIDQPGAVFKRQGIGWRQIRNRTHTETVFIQISSAP